jgi:hypothetical protein
MPKLNNDTIDFNQGYKALSDLLVSKDVPIEITSFDRFVQEIGCKSYPDYKFDSWHIRKICQWCDEVMASDRRLGLAALPRGHLKSTLLGYLFSIYRFLTGFGDSLYVSYKEELSLYHMSNIKSAINNNPILNKFCKDLTPTSNSQIHYRVGSKVIRMFGSGIFAVKRGLHCNGVVIVDDILGTVDNPMVLTELNHAENNFNSEIVPIPNRGCPMLIYGTVMDYSDLLFKLKENPQYQNPPPLWLPALNPTPDHEVLWDRYDKVELEKRKQQQGWKAFSTEYLLIPVLALNAFFSREDMDKIINKKLVDYKIGRSNGDEWWRNYPIIAGYDIGKKRNPSHMAVFAVVDNPSSSTMPQKMVMIHQKFFDNWEYTKQIEYIYDAVDFFQIQRMYYDNTRSEFDERNLPRGCTAIVLGSRTGNTAKGKMQLAINFSKLVEQNKIELIDDDRYIAQLLSVTNDLQAPTSGTEHGDAFISTMLAIGVFSDFYETNRKNGFSYLGDLQVMMQGTDGMRETSAKNNDSIMPFNKELMKYVCKICNSKLYEIDFEGNKRCVRCRTLLN